MKSLKQMLRSKRVIVGMTTQHIIAPWLVKLWKRSGADFVYLEYEHGFWNEADLAGFVLCCRAEDLPVVSKVPECSRTHVTRLLDCGVTGIQLPWTESREQIDRLVSYVKFPPLGIRAVCPGMGNCDYDLHVNGKEFIEQSNSETVVLAHVETRKGVESIDEILSSPHVDVAFVGIYDLTISLGHPGEFTHPEVEAAIERVMASARKWEKVVGLWRPDYATAKPWIEKGVSFFEAPSEVDLIDAGARRLIADFRSAS